MPHDEPGSSTGGDEAQRDTDPVRTVATRVLEAARLRELCLKAYRAACSHGTQLGNGALEFYRYLQFLKGAGLADEGQTEPEGDTPHEAPPDLDPDTADEIASARHDAYADALKEYEKARAEEAAQAHSNAQSAASALKYSDAVRQEEAVSQGKGFRTRRLSAGLSSVHDIEATARPTAAGRAQGVARLLTFTEADNLFQTSLSRGRDTLSFKDFSVVLVALAAKLYPTDYSMRPTQAVQRLHDERLRAYVCRLCPTTEEELAALHPLQTCTGVPEILLQYALPLRRVFSFYAHQGEVTFDVADVEAAPKGVLSFEALIALLSDLQVTPVPVPHQVAYNVFFECAAAGGASLTTSPSIDLSFPACVNLLLKISYRVFTSEPHCSTLPTLASRVQCVMDRLDTLYPVKLGKPISDELSEPRMGLPRPFLLDPAVSGLRGGYAITIQGRYYNKATGVFVRFGDEVVPASEVSSAKVRAAVPSQEPNEYACDLRLKQDSYHVTVTYLRRVSVSVSNDGVSYAKPLTLRCVEVAAEFTLTELQAKLLGVFQEYCSRGDFSNDRYMSYERWMQFKDDYGIAGNEPLLPVSSLGGDDSDVAQEQSVDVQDTQATEEGAEGAPQPPAADVIFQKTACTAHGSQALTFRQFLRALVSTLVSRMYHSNGCTLNAASNTTLYDELRNFLGVERASEHLSKQLQHDQASFTKQYLGQMHTTLAHLNVTQFRRDNSPGDPGNDEPDPIPVGRGELTNGDQVEAMLLAHLKKSKEVSDRQGFDAWRDSMARDEAVKADLSAALLPTADTHLVDTVAASLEQGADMARINPAVVPPVPILDSEITHRHENAAPNGGVPQSIIPQPQRAEGDERAKSMAAVCSSMAVGASALQGALLRLSGDRNNTVQRKFFMIEAKLRRQVEHLTEELQRKEAFVGQLQVITREARRRDGAGMLEKEMVDATNTALAGDMAAIAEQKERDREKLAKQEEEDRMKEMVDVEIRKFLKGFKTSLDASDKKFCSMANLLANQTQWLDAQRVILSRLQYKLRIAECESESFKLFSEMIQEQLEEVTNEEELQEVLAVVRQERDRVEKRQAIVTDKIRSKQEEVEAEASEGVSVLRQLIDHVHGFEDQLRADEEGGDHLAESTNRKPKKGKKGKKSKHAEADRETPPGSPAPLPPFLAKSIPDLGNGGGGNEAEIVELEETHAAVVSALEDKITVLQDELQIMREMRSRQPSADAAASQRSNSPPGSARRERQDSHASTTAPPATHRTRASHNEGPEQEEGEQAHAPEGEGGAEAEGSRAGEVGPGDHDADPQGDAAGFPPGTPQGPSSRRGSKHKLEAAMQLYQEEMQEAVAGHMDERAQVIGDALEAAVQGQAVVLPGKKGGKDQKAARKRSMKVAADVASRLVSKGGAKGGPRRSVARGSAVSISDDRPQLRQLQEIVPENSSAGVFICVTNPGETVESVAGRFDVDVSDVIARNPDYPWDRPFGEGHGRLVIPLSGEVVDMLHDFEDMRKMRFDEVADHPILKTDTLASVAELYRHSTRTLVQCNFLPEDPARYGDPDFISGIPSRMLRVPYNQSELGREEITEVHAAAVARSEEEKRQVQEELKQELLRKADDSNPFKLLAATNMFAGMFGQSGDDTAKPKGLKALARGAVKQSLASSQEAKRPSVPSIASVSSARRLSNQVAKMAVSRHRRRSSATLSDVPAEASASQPASPRIMLPKPDTKKEAAEVASLEQREEEGRAGIAEQEGGGFERCAEQHGAAEAQAHRAAGYRVQAEEAQRDAEEMRLRLDALEQLQRIPRHEMEIQTDEVVQEEPHQQQEEVGLATPPPEPAAAAAEALPGSTFLGTSQGAAKVAMLRSEADSIRTGLEQLKACVWGHHEALVHECKVELVRFAEKLEDQERRRRETLALEVLRSERQADDPALRVLETPPMPHRYPPPVPLGSHHHPGVGEVASCTKTQVPVQGAQQQPLSQVIKARKKPRSSSGPKVAMDIVPLVEGHPSALSDTLGSSQEGGRARSPSPPALHMLRLDDDADDTSVYAGSFPIRSSSFSAMLGSLAMSGESSRAGTAATAERAGGSPSGVAPPKLPDARPPDGQGQAGPKAGPDVKPVSKKAAPSATLTTAKMNDPSQRLSFERASAFLLAAWRQRRQAIVLESSEGYDRIVVLQRSSRTALGRKVVAQRWAGEKLQEAKCSRTELAVALYHTQRRSHVDEEHKRMFVLNQRKVHLAVKSSLDTAFKEARTNRHLAHHHTCSTRGSPVTSPELPAGAPQAPSSAPMPPLRRSPGTAPLDMPAVIPRVPAASITPLERHSKVHQNEISHPYDHTPASLMAIQNSRNFTSDQIRVLQRVSNMEEALPHHDRTLPRADNGSHALLRNMALIETTVASPTLAKLSDRERFAMSSRREHELLDQLHASARLHKSWAPTLRVPQSENVIHSSRTGLFESVPPNMPSLIGKSPLPQLPPKSLRTG